MLEVRRAVAEKLQSTIIRLQVQCACICSVAAVCKRVQCGVFVNLCPSSIICCVVQDRQPTRASKYASMLFMTGADPAAANQAAALRHLREFVHRHRCPYLCLAPLQSAVHVATSQW